MTDQYPAIGSGVLEPFEDFVHRHVGPSDEEHVAMLKVLGYESLDAMIDAAVPGGVRSVGRARPAAGRLGARGAR